MTERRVVFSERDYRAALEARAAKTIGRPLSPSPTGAGGADVTPSSDNGEGLTHIRDLLTEPDDEVSWIVDGLLPAGGLSGIFSKPKAGKSTTARAIVLHVARGEPVLGRGTTQGPAVYVGLEDHRRVTREHLKALGARTSDDLYVFTGTRPDAALSWLERVLARVDPVLVVLDTLQHMLSIRDMNDYSGTVEALRQVLGLVRSRRGHIMISHHAGKGDRRDFDAILGSTGILGTVDTALLLRRREDGTRTIATRQRAGEDLPESVLLLDDHQEPQLAGLRADHAQQQAETGVLDWLATQAERVGRAEVLAGVEGAANVNTRALYALAKGGDRVARTGRGVKGDPFLYTCIPLYTHAGMQESESAQESRANATIACMPDSAPEAIPLPTGMQETDPDPDTAARDAMRAGA